MSHYPRPPRAELKWGCHCSFEIHACTLTIFHALFLFCSETSKRTIHKAVSMDIMQSLFQQMLCQSLMKELAGETFSSLNRVTWLVWSFCLPTDLYVRVCGRYQKFLFLLSTRAVSGVIILVCAFL